MTSQDEAPVMSARTSHLKGYDSEMSLKLATHSRMHNDTLHNKIATFKHRDRSAKRLSLRILIYTACIGARSLTRPV